MPPFHASGLDPGAAALMIGRPATSFDPARNIPMSDEPYKSWQCRTCGYIYDEAKGEPDEGLGPGTRWAEIPDDWVCPQCGTAKSDFDMVEL
jgi:rubredoxin